MSPPTTTTTTDGNLLVSRGVTADCSKLDNLHNNMDDLCAKIQSVKLVSKPTSLSGPIVLDQTVSKNGASSSQYGKYVSPAEFLQLNRMNASAIASKSIPRSRNFAPTQQCTPPGFLMTPMGLAEELPELTLKLKKSMVLSDAKKNNSNIDDAKSVDSGNDDSCSSEEKDRLVGRGHVDRYPSNRDERMQPYSVQQSNRNACSGQQQQLPPGYSTDVSKTPGQFLRSQQNSFWDTAAVGGSSSKMYTAEEYLQFDPPDSLSSYSPASVSMGDASPASANHMNGQSFLFNQQSQSCTGGQYSPEPDDLQIHIAQSVLQPKQSDDIIPANIVDFILNNSRIYNNEQDDSGASSPVSSSQSTASPLSVNSNLSSDHSPPTTRCERFTDLDFAVLHNQPERTEPSPPVGLVPVRNTPFARRASMTARDLLRNSIPESAFVGGIAWLAQFKKEEIYCEDKDGDTLLHICVWHQDIPKIYCLTERMIRDDSAPDCKPFDYLNNGNETPLFLAVEKNMPKVVSYLLECGADTNIQVLKGEGDGPLHCAAGRGMKEVVIELTNAKNIQLNMPNGSGFTALLCAVKNHGIIEEENQCLINNKPTIRALLKAGADAKIQEVSTFNSVLHYAVERMDPELIEIFKDSLDGESMRQLTNMPNCDGNTPLHLLGIMAQTRCATLSKGQAEEELRRKIFYVLVDCGADTQARNGNGATPVLPFVADH